MHVKVVCVTMSIDIDIVDDVCVKQIFAKADITPKCQILEELEALEPEALEQSRAQLYGIAVEKLTKWLSQRNLPPPKISLKNLMHY